MRLADGFTMIPTWSHSEAVKNLVIFAPLCFDEKSTRSPVETEATDDETGTFSGSSPSIVPAPIDEAGCGEKASPAPYR